MKIAIMSDVHGNPKAFRAALDDAKKNKAEKIILLGDVVGYGYDPMACIKLAKENCDVVLKGNHDAGTIGELSLGWFSQTAQNGVMRHRNQIDEEARKWLSSLPHTHVDWTHGFVCSHGTYCMPDRFEYIQGGCEAQMDMGYVQKETGITIGFVGHTHYSTIYYWNTEKYAEVIAQKHYFCGYKEYEGKGTIELDPENTYSVNVGSIGYPRNELDSVYVIFNTDKRTIEYRRLPFNAEEYQDALGKDGISIPRWLAYRIDEMKKLDAAPRK